MPPVPPYDSHLMENLRPARSYVDVDWARSSVSGWILCADRELDSVQIYCDGKLAASAPLHRYAEVAGIYPNIPHAAVSGFAVDVKAETFGANRIHSITNIGYRNDTRIARRDVLVFDPALMPSVPTPPAELIGRTQDGHDPKQYKTLGYLYYKQLRNVLARYRDPNSVRRILDFGCGSGRVLANFLGDTSVELAVGVDIDANAISWAKANLPKAHWTVIDAAPPLPFGDASFDAVISLAVFAAFGTKEQALWLPELRRVTAPGGLVLVSVQGAFSASFLHPRPFLTELQNDGIIERDRYHVMKEPLGLVPLPRSVSDTRICLAGMVRVV